MGDKKPRTRDEKSKWNTYLGGRKKMGDGNYRVMGEANKQGYGEKGRLARR